MKTKIHIEKRRLLGYIAGITAGVSYGMNPLFGKALMESGVPVMVMLFFRYGFAAVFTAMLMLVRKEPFKVGKREIGLLILLGLLFAGSSITLFTSYAFIPSGLATTLVYLYPVFVALIMVFLRIYPSWQTWLSILAPSPASCCFPPRRAMRRSGWPASCWPSGRPFAIRSIWSS